MCDLEPCRLRPWHCINAPCDVVPVSLERNGCTQRLQYTVFLDRCHTDETSTFRSRLQAAMAAIRCGSVHIHLLLPPSGRNGGHPAQGSWTTSISTCVWKAVMRAIRLGFLGHVDLPPTPSGHHGGHAARAHGSSQSQVLLSP